MGPGFRLLLQFAVVSIVPLVALGSVLGSQLRRSMERRALLTYAQSTSAAAEVMAETYLRAPSPASGKALPDLTAVVTKATPMKDFGAIVRMVDPFGRITYSATKGEIGTFAGPNPDRARARKGEIVSHWIAASAVPDRVAGERYFTMVMPLKIGALTAGTLEIIAQDTDVTASIAADVKRAYQSLAVGLALLWLSLVPIVWRVSRRLAHQAEDNERMAQHDALTGLPNRAYLLRRGAESVARDPRTGLLLIDLDNFKDINDTLGHGAGDLLLVHVGREVARMTRSNDVVARLGGDEFAVLLPNVASERELAEAADRIKAGLEKPTSIDGILVSADASIGIALAPDHGTTIDQLMQRADIAMYASKERSSGPVSYTPDIDLHSPTRLALTAELRTALARNDEIRIVFQPIVDALTGEIVSAEVLGRWDNPARGPVLPAEFIGLAERSGLIRVFTERLAEATAAQLEIWRGEGLDLPLSLNLSTKNLSESDLPERLVDVFGRHGIRPTDLTLEVTETGLVEETTGALELVRRLRSHGFRLALDDFGTGYSSLTYLRTLHADVLKIDRSFVRQIIENTNDSRIVSAVIDMAHSLDMVVVAEGVETSEQWSRLIQLGCDRLQGFLFSRPVTAEELALAINANAGFVRSQTDVALRRLPRPSL